MTKELQIFRDSFDLEAAIKAVRENGYYFENDALVPAARFALFDEIESLPLEVGDHIASPINKGKPNEVKQQHARAYYEYLDKSVPVANLVIGSLTQMVRNMRSFPELIEWQLNEVGYQKYRPGIDFIGPHRDRGSDKLLSATFTISGSAKVKIFKPLGDYWDYSNVEQTDEFITGPGTLMMLRAPGFGDGEQVIHQVLPPEIGVRNILNLRMRPTVLEQPNHPKWQN